MTRMSRARGIGRLIGSEPGQGTWERFAWPAIVACLVAGGIASLLERFLFDVPISAIVSWLKPSLALDPDVRTVVGLTGDVAIVLYSLLGAWVSGGVARRLARGAEDLPRVARTLAWLLAGLGGLSLAVAVWRFVQLGAMLADMPPGAAAEAWRPGVERFGPIALAVFQLLVIPFVGRASVLRVAREHRR
jgi:hypothetical protein